MFENKTDIKLVKVLAALAISIAIALSAGVVQASANAALTPPMPETAVTPTDDYTKDFLESVANYDYTRWYEGVRGLHIIDDAGVLSSKVRKTQEERLQALFKDRQFNVVVYFASEDEGSSYDDLEFLSSMLTQEYDMGGPNDNDDYPFFIAIICPSNSNCLQIDGNIDKLHASKGLFREVFDETIAKTDADNYDKCLTDIVDSAVRLADDPNAAHRAVQNSQWFDSFFGWPFLVGLVAILVIGVVIGIIASRSSKKKKAAAAQQQAQFQPQQVYPSRRAYPQASYPAQQAYPQRQAYPPRQQAYPQQKESLPPEIYTQSPWPQDPAQMTDEQISLNYPAHYQKLQESRRKGVYVPAEQDHAPYTQAPQQSQFFPPVQNQPFDRPNIPDGEQPAGVYIPPEEFERLSNTPYSAQQDPFGQPEATSPQPNSLNIKPYVPKNKGGDTK